MKALVTFAVESEFRRWRQARRFSPAGAVGYLAFETRLEADEVGVLLTGIGFGQAARAARAALNEQVDACISSGFVGGLKPAQRVGEILVARCVEMGDAVTIASDVGLFELAVGCGATPVEAFRTSETLVRRAEEKFRLGAVADGVEMESYAVLAAAAERGVPAVAIRAVSDTVAMNLPYAFDEAVDARGQIRLSRLLAQFASGPQRLPALIRMARQYHRAAGSLADFLERYLEAWRCTRSESALAWELACT